MDEFTKNTNAREHLRSEPIERIQPLKGHKFPVLDDGFICLQDVMGSDADICQAARTSYQKGTKSTSDNETLIRYLMRHRHTSPFEMAELKFMVRVPMDCWRQWVRHRTANINEYSTRYSEAIESQQKTAPDQWRAQSKNNKQGSSGDDLHWPELEKNQYDPRNDNACKNLRELLTEMEKRTQSHARFTYEQRIACGVAREQARKDLPLSTYTEAYWKIDLHNLLHFLSLRMDSHAQQEIREYANIIGNEIVAKLFPLTWQAFQDYRLNSVTLSAFDIKVAQILSNPMNPKPTTKEGFYKITEEAGIKNKREITDCFGKMICLGLLNWSF